MSGIEFIPDEESENDAFSGVLPLPYRVAIIIVLGIWAWGLNLHYLSLIRIDVPGLIQYPSRTSSLHHSHHRSAYQFASLLSISLAAFLLLFWFVRILNPSLAALLPNLYLFCLFLAFISPIRIARSGRLHFLQTLRRISIGGLAEPSDGKFGDILLADVLTSYAKVLGDIYVAICVAVNRNHDRIQPDKSCGGPFVIPLLISVPSLIRLRQCLIEYSRVRKSIRTGVTTSTGWGGQHLANALKYSTAFPVIILSALQRYKYYPDAQGTMDVTMSEKAVASLWLISVFVNSFYSFYWDVMKDWDLTLLSQQRLPPLDATSKRPEYPYGLRRHRYFHSNNMYYIVIALDLFLRCTWSFKLSPHLQHGYNTSSGIFILEMLEVFRRWVWIFFRIETEWVRTSKAPAPDDVLLGDYNGKFDDD